MVPVHGARLPQSGKLAWCGCQILNKPAATGYVLRGARARSQIATEWETGLVRLPNLKQTGCYRMCAPSHLFQIVAYECIHIVNIHILTTIWNRCDGAYILQQFGCVVHVMIDNLSILLILITIIIQSCPKGGGGVF